MSSRPSSCTIGSAAADDEVDAVLRAHDAEVGDEVPPAAAQLGVGGRAAQPLGVRAGADDGDVARRRLPPRVDRRSRGTSSFVEMTWSAVRKRRAARAAQQAA